MRIARHIKTRQFAAVKIVSKSALANKPTLHDVLLNTEREIVIMKLIDHPNIIRLYDVWETSSDLYLIFEYIEGGELFDYICDKGRLSTSEALDYFQQIIFAVDYCHRFNIAHRDLKPENILIDKDKNIKIADFGMAAWQARTKNGLLHTVCGTPHYIAPEIIMGNEYDGRSSDVWSCGIILFALLAGYLPFDDVDLVSVLEKVKLAKYKVPRGINPMAKDLISKMLQKNAEARITIPQILKHPFFLSQRPKMARKDMPDLDLMSRPVTKKECIDDDIFANLRTLWHGTPDEDIIECLTNDQPTWEKGVYHLLVAYRYKHLENYDDEEEINAQARKKKDTEKELPRRVECTLSQATDPKSPTYLPPRADPPTPRRARRSLCELPQVNALQISLPSDTPRSPPTPNTRPHSVLTVPTKGDEDTMFEFFHQIVERLNAMEACTNTATPPMEADYGLEQRSASLDDTELLREPKHNRTDDLFGIGIASPGKVLRRSTELDKENQSVQVNPPGILRKPSVRSNDVETKRPIPRVRIISPPKRLRRKKSFTAPITLLDRRPSLSRWLSGVFRFKPTSYELLSTRNAFTSREECRRLLWELGVQVSLTHAEEAGVLECKFDGVENPSGVLPVLKFVRFRVEVQQPTTPQALAGYQVALRFTLEKGASSSFETICHRVRRMWELDLPRL